MKRTIGAILLLLQTAAISDGEFRTFRNADGREIVAQIGDYDADGNNVQLVLKNGKSGWMSVSTLSAEDRNFIGLWKQRAQFLDPKQLDIEILVEDTGWKHDGDAHRDRKERWTRYQVRLANHGNADLNSIRIQKCLYREKKGGSGVDHSEESIKLVPAGESVTEKFGGHGSFKVASEGFINEVVGARFRFYWTAPDGTELTRDICQPEDLSEKKYPWKEPEFTEEALAKKPKPKVALSPKNLTKDDVKALAIKYAEAWEDHDYAAWRALLEPLHYGNSDLSEGVFNRYQVNDVNIKDVEGLNVYVQMTYKGGHKQLGWLQFHSSGTLKYTPLLFKHPVAGVLNSFRLLYNNDSSWSGGAVRDLREAGIPLFGFNLKASESDKQDAIEKIYDWLDQNGATYDASEPKLTIPEDQFEELMKKAKSYVKRGSFYGS